MKHFKTFVIIALVTFGINTAAQAQKVAHVNFQELLMAMPETASLNSEIEKTSKTYENDIKAAAEKLKAKIKRYEAEFKTQTQEENQKRQLELQQDEQSIMKTQQIARQDLGLKNQKGLEVISKKLQIAIEKVAIAQGFEYVLEASSLVVKKGKDLTADVKSSLGL
ncbi:MAG: OmpH family outer membrane protein [Flavobacteriaceae bacterium]|nr:OmpH family outer membrane protein [Flavobacteriaceae bacterium]